MAPDLDNPARPQPGDIVCALADVKPDGAIVLDFKKGDARFSLLVTRSEAGVSAFENVCPHARSPLERPDGRVVVHQKKFVICAAHGASFQIDTGRCVAGPGLGLGLNRVAVSVLGGQIRIA
jgi:nitrite reductase/ring-hydroxylating ferredoxin subunit